MGECEVLTRIKIVDFLPDGECSEKAWGMFLLGDRVPLGYSYHHLLQSVSVSFP